MYRQPINRSASLVPLCQLRGGLYPSLCLLAMQWRERWRCWNCSGFGFSDMLCTLFIPFCPGLPRVFGPHFLKEKTAASLEHGGNPDSAPCGPNSELSNPCVVGSSCCESPSCCPSGGAIQGSVEADLTSQFSSFLKLVKMSC